MDKIIIKILIIIVFYLLGQLIMFIEKKRHKGAATSCKNSTYTIRNFLPMKILSIVNLLFFSFLFVNSTINYFNGTEVLWVVWFFGIYVFASLLFALLAFVWCIKVDNKEIVYRNLLGIVHRYKFDEIRVVMDNMLNIKVYKCGRHIFSLPNMVENWGNFVYWSKMYGVFGDDKYEDGRFRKNKTN